MKYTKETEKAGISVACAAVGSRSFSYHLKDSDEGTWCEKVSVHRCVLQNTKDPGGSRGLLPVLKREERKEVVDVFRPAGCMISRK